MLIKLIESAAIQLGKFKDRVIMRILAIVSEAWSNTTLVVCSNFRSCEIFAHVISADLFYQLRKTLISRMYDQVTCNNKH